MADQTTGGAGEFPPYRREKDPLHTTPRVLKYYEVSLEGIPPTPLAVPVVDDQSKNVNKQNDSISKIEGITSKTSSEDIKSLLGEFATLKSDINRLARFAICRNAVKVIQYLVWEEGADLSCYDTENRSASCYAMWDYPDNGMFVFLMSISAGREDFGLQNYWGDALYFAVTFKCLNALDFLLTHVHTDAQITDEITDEWATRWGSVWGRGFGEAWFLRSLLGFKYLEHEIYPIFCMSARRDGRIGCFWSHGEDRIFTWVHLPWANGIPFFFALRRYGQNAGCPTRGTDWLPSLFRQPLKAPTNPDLPYSDPMYESSFGTTFGDVPRAFMIFPCLVLRSKGSQEEARNRINDIRKNIPSKLTKGMLGPELTLDEAYFPSLPTKVLAKRNNSQVVSRMHKGTNTREDTEDSTQPILMVAQLWIWRCSTYILTAFSENDPKNTRHWNKERVENFIGHLGTFVSQTPVSPCIQIGLILAHQILEFDNPQTDGEFGNPQVYAKFSSPLDIFEESTAKVLEDVTEYMDLSVQPQSNTDPIVQSRLDIRKEQEFMFQIADIREELAMINQVLEQQFEVLQAFIEDSERYDPDLHSSSDHEATRKLSEADKDEIADKTSKAEKKAIKKEGAEKKKKNKQEEAEKKKKWNQVKGSKNMIKKYQKRVTKIDEDAARVEKQIQDQLNLKRTYVSIQDAHASLKLGSAGLALSTTGLILSTAVAGFTIITIIFAPLAFVTALFALPIDMLLSNQVPFDRPGGDAQATVAYSTSYIGKWFAVAELVSLTVTFLLIALCVWPFRKSFSTLQESLSETKPDETVSAAEEASTGDSPSGQEQTNLRRRFARRLVGLNSRRSTVSNCESGQGG